MMKQDTNTPNPLATISIVSHGDAEKIAALLESLRQYESAKKLQIIVTDNLGSDLPELDSSPWVSLTILRNKKPLGFSRNHNQAFQLTAGKYFCVLNPDVLFEEPLFHRLINLLEKEKAEIVSPLIIDANNIIQDSFRDFPTPLDILKRKLPGYYFTPLAPDTSGLIRPDWIAGIFMFMRSETYRQLGGFDEKFYLYFEDVDICARARTLGLIPLVDTNLRVQHNAQRASRKKLRYLLWHLQSAYRFFTSHTYRRAKEKKKKIVEGM